MSINISKIYRNPRLTVPVGLILVIMIFVIAGSRSPHLHVLHPQGSRGRLQYLASSPLIVTAVVLAVHEVGWTHETSTDGEVQLCRLKVNVEHILQGPRVTGDLDIYLFEARGSSGGMRRMGFEPGSLDIFYLRNEAGVWRTACDLHSFCVNDILTGRHSAFKRTPGSSIADDILQILLTRGDPVTSDGVMVDALAGSVEPYLSYGFEWRYKHPKTYIDILQRTAQTETPPVRAEACELLKEIGTPCQPCTSGQ